MLPEFFCAKRRAAKGSWLTLAATAATRRSEAEAGAKRRAAKGSWLTLAATAATRRSEAEAGARSDEPQRGAGSP